MNTYLALDFGGTRSRAALFDRDLRLIRRAETLSEVREGTGPVLRRLADLGRSLLEADTAIAGIGIAAPGPLDADAGVIIKAHTLPGWSHVPLAAMISEAFDGAPTVIQNDGNLGALAEYHLGAGRGADPLIYLTLSTGIGGGVIIDGKLFSGADGLAIEPGHMRLSLRDGSHRRWEELASGTALGDCATLVLQQSDRPSSLRNLQQVDGQAVGDAARRGDELALRIVRRAGEWLGLGLVNLLHLFNPEAIVVGGSVSTLGELILGPARAVIREQVLYEGFYRENLIRRAALNDDVCLVGAALYSKLQLEDGHNPN